MDQYSWHDKKCHIGKDGNSEPGYRLYRTADFCKCEISLSIWVDTRLLQKYLGELHYSGFQKTINKNKNMGIIISKNDKDIDYHHGKSKINITYHLPCLSIITQYWLHAQCAQHHINNFWALHAAISQWWNMCRINSPCTLVLSYVLQSDMNIYFQGYCYLGI